MKTVAIHTSLIILAILISAFLISTVPAKGAGYLGNAVHLQSATTTAVGPDINIEIFADDANGTCKSRVITTTNSAIMLSFGDETSFTLSGGAGHWQGASTTVAYDSGLYGCGSWSAYGYASTTLTVSNF